MEIGLFMCFVTVGKPRKRISITGRTKNNDEN